MSRSALTEHIRCEPRLCANSDSSQSSNQLLLVTDQSNKNMNTPWRIVAGPIIYDPSLFLCCLALLRTSNTNTTRLCGVNHPLLHSRFKCDYVRLSLDTVKSGDLRMRKLVAHCVMRWRCFFELHWYRQKLWGDAENIELVEIHSYILKASVLPSREKVLEDL